MMTDPGTREPHRGCGCQGTADGPRGTAAARGILLRTLARVGGCRREFTAAFFTLLALGVVAAASLSPGTLLVLVVLAAAFVVLSAMVLAIATAELALGGGFVGQSLLQPNGDDIAPLSMARRRVARAMMSRREVDPSD